MGPLAVRVADFDTTHTQQSEASKGGTKGEFTVDLSTSNYIPITSVTSYKLYFRSFVCDSMTPVLSINVQVVQPVCCCIIQGKKATVTLCVKAGVYNMFSADLIVGNYSIERVWLLLADSFFCLLQHYSMHSYEQKGCTLELFIETRREFCESLYDVDIFAECLYTPYVFSYYIKSLY